MKKSVIYLFVGFLLRELRHSKGKGSLVSFVVSLNLHRRHLSSIQKAAVAVDILPFLESEAKGRMAEAGKKHSGNQYSNKMEGVQKIEHLPNGQNGNKAISKAAESVGTNRQYVSDMKRYKQETPDVYEAAKSGKINGSEAYFFLC